MDTTLTKDYRHFIPAPPSVITLGSWEMRNGLADQYYPQILDLMRFDEDHLLDILLDVEQAQKPPREFAVGGAGLGRPLAYLPRRSHLEWHLFRGRAPAARRDSIPRSVREAVIARNGYVCGICRGQVAPDDVHLDHIRPWSRGGPDTISNLRVAHSLCNIRRGAPEDDS